MDIALKLLEAAGSLCLLYFVFIMIYVGPRISFHYIWLVSGLVLRFIAGAVENGSWYRIPGGLRALFLVLLLLGGLLLIAMEIRIFSGMRAVPEEPVRYVIVLGACIRGVRVTRSLSYRLKKAAAYARSHPDCMLVVSGGQGPGEDVTEASAMSGYLQNLGIVPERILLEDRSVNTRENLLFSREIICRHAETSDENLSVAICSNNFHIYRALALAQMVGDWKVSGLAARTDPFMWLSFTLREGIALFKERLFGHIARF